MCMVDKGIGGHEQPITMGLPTVAELPIFPRRQGKRFVEAADVLEQASGNRKVVRCKEGWRRWSPFGSPALRRGMMLIEVIHHKLARRRVGVPG